MDFADAMAAALSVFPNATLGEDNDGQIVVYTNLMVKPIHDLTGEETGDTVLVDMDEWIDIGGEG